MQESGAVQDVIPEEASGRVRESEAAAWRRQDSARQWRVASRRLEHVAGADPRARMELVNACAIVPRAMPYVLPAHTSARCAPRPGADHASLRAAAACAAPREWLER